MAITIITHPLTPNLANNRVVYTVQSTRTNEPQFKYVLDINDRSGTLLQRLKNQPAPGITRATFDIGQVLTTYLGPTDQVWTTGTANDPEPNIYCADEFQIRIGEEYAQSATGFPDIYPGNYTGGGSAIPGDPAVSSSYYHYFVDGTLDINTGPFATLSNGGWSWDYTTKYDEESTDGSTTFTHQNGLTDWDTCEVRSGDYHTLSFLNGNLDGLPNADIDNTEAQDIFAMLIKQYDVNGSLLSTDTYYNFGDDKRSSASDFYDDIYLNQNFRTRLVHFPAGPQNLTDAGVTISGNTDYYVLSFHNQTSEPGVNEDGVYGSYRFNIEDAACDYPGTRFTWKNKYGVWDYFNFELAEGTTSEITRESFEQSYIDYGATIPTNDTERRGKTQFQNRITKRRTAESQYLTQTEADNLRELFYSTNVYVQDTANSRFLPVVITNASVTEKTNPRSQKLFRYTVEWEYANETQARV